MSTPIKMPQMGESVVEGTVSRWLKSPGDAVEKLEPLLEVSTDKIDTEIPAPISGTLLEITVGEGTTVDAGTVIGYIGEAGEEPPSASAGDTTGGSAGDSAQAAVSGNETVAPLAEQRLAEPSQLSPKTNRGGRVGEVPRPIGRDFVSPVVGRIAAEHGVDVSKLSGTGMNGRVTKKDLLAFLETGQKAGEGVSQGSSGPATGDGVQPRSQSMGGGMQSLASAQPPSSVESGPSPQSLSEDEVLHPLTTMRRAIAQHMVQSKATSPHVTTVFEVDMTRVVQHREAEKAGFLARGVALNYTAYFVAATAAALRNEPTVNARFTDDGIVTQRRVHIGIAAAIDDGLVVPVLRDADELNLHGVARGVQDLSARARSGRLTADEMRGGTFTISNHGVGGSLIGTPVINQPQAGILGVGAIVKRPVVVGSRSLLPSADDAIVIRPMCYLSFTFDHRILDGAGADRFVMRIKEMLEGWSAEQQVS